jgi:3-methyl-2-oxobutanoate hydroxymethyltransferase
MVVVDMPFMSYQQSPREALRHAGRIIKETGAHAVKLEGGLEMVDTVKQLVSMGIPVMGHLGLLPQSVNQQGGYKVQGKKDEDEERLQKDIRVLEEAGCFAVVLECIPRLLAKNLTARVSIPTIGIGAGVDCDGQILVWHDLLGLTEGPSPKFLKRYVNLSLGIREALRAYQKEVVSVEFPSLEYSY